jgi:hypothetical protein
MQLLQFGTAEAWMTIRPLAQLAGFNAPPRGRYNAPNDINVIRLRMGESPQSLDDARPVV